MENKGYQKQVGLLLSALPEVAKEKCFALHGGTAINLFVRDMPRLSVDIDLIYIRVEDRASSLKHISEALGQIKGRIEKAIPKVRVQHKQDIGKLIIISSEVQIKVEVNLVGRGTIAEPVIMALCDKAQSKFSAFAAIQVVPIGQLYGGKICAALDRQHPRDLFDVKYLLENEGFSDEIRKGFLLCLLGSDRPIHEIISPNLQDQRTVFTNQFAGMSEETFSYDDYEQTRAFLLSTIREKLTSEDKQFLLGVTNITPDWQIHDFEKFPAVQWKLQNLQKLKASNPDKHRGQYEVLKEILDNSTNPLGSN